VRTIPQRLGASLVALFGIALVVTTMVVVMSIGAGFKASLREPGPWRFSLYGFGECLPNPDNYIELDPAVKDKWGIPALRIHCRWRENERAMLKDMAVTATEMLEAAGATVKLMCDFNQGLSLGDALVRCHALDDQGLYWFEEPTTYDNIQGYAQLARELKTPVQLGENFYGPRLLYQAVLAGAGDYVMPDLMRIGGVSGWLRAAAITGAAGIPTSTHLYPEVAAHLMRVTDTAHWLEWQDWADPILSEPFQLKDGHLMVPDRPGHGIAWDEKAVARFAR